MKTNVGTRVSKSLAEDIEYLAREGNADKSKIVRELLARAIFQRLLELSLDKYSKKEISLGRAAELAKIPLVDFMKLAVERKVVMNYSLESLKEDFRAALKTYKKK